MGRKVYVVGVGMTKFEKPGSREWDYPDMAQEAGTRALADAGVDYVEIVGRALSEDLGSRGDITSDACVPQSAESRGAFVARGAGVIAGLEVAAYVFEALDPSVIFAPLLADGERVDRR